MLRLITVFCSLIFCIKANYDKSIFPANILEAFENAHNHCQLETGVPEELITDVNTRKGFAEDERLKCYVKCIMFATATMKSDSSIGMEILDNALSFHPDIETLKQMFKQCEGQIVETDLCERAQEFHRCLYNVNADVYFIP